MPTTLSDQTQILFATVIERLETSPVEFVEALIDLFAAPERKRDEQLLRDLLIQTWLLLECPELFPLPTYPINASKKSSRSAPLTRYEQLIELMCNVVEKEIIRLVPFNQERLSLNGKSMQHFWGGLVLHIKLALPLEPCRGTPLYSNGVVTISNAKSIPCEPPLSESQIYSFLTELGNSFVFEYANAYIHNEQFCSLITQFAQAPKTITASKNDSVQFQLVVQERTLNRYVDKFAKRLAAHFRDACKRSTENSPNRFHALLGPSSPDSILSQWIADASDALCIYPKPVESHNRELKVKRSTPQVGENYTSDGASRIVASREFDYREVLEGFTRFQEAAIRDSVHTTFVAQDLIYHDVGSTESRRTEISELVNSTNPHLVIAAPPGGGKTRFLQKILLLTHTSKVYHLYVNATEFSVARFRTFYHFAANEILTRSDSDRRDILNLENDLLMLDMNGNIIWYLDDWDCNCQRDLSSVSSSLAGLGKFILVTSNPFLPIEQLSSNGLGPSGFVKILPFTQSQITEFIKLNSPAPSPGQARAERRALQLPGLAQYPNGLQYICSHPEHETVVDVLLGFINSILKKNKESVFNLDGVVLNNFEKILRESNSVGACFPIVKALCSRARGTNDDFTSITIDEILPYMGASNQAENRQLAMEKIARAMEGGFLQLNDDGQSYRFVVPEVGFLFSAITSLSKHHNRRWLDVVAREFQSNPHEPIRQTVLAFAAWCQEKLLMQDISVLPDKNRGSHLSRNLP